MRSVRLVDRLAAAVFLGLVGCGAPVPPPTLPATVWAPRSDAARIGPMRRIDTRLSAGGDSVVLDLPTDHLEKGALVHKGGSMSTHPDARDVERDPALSVDANALLEFSVAAGDGLSPVAIRTGATRSAPDEIRYALTGKAECLGDVTWWEFRRLPLGD